MFMFTSTVTNGISLPFSPLKLVKFWFSNCYSLVPKFLVSFISTPLLYIVKLYHIIKIFFVNKYLNKK